MFKATLLIFLISQLFLSLFANNDSTPIGALISVEFESEVGFLLDEIPTSYGTRDKAINFIKNYVTEDQWKERAILQAKATMVRQVFRPSYYPGKLQLTFPPREIWQITFNEKPMYRKRKGHEYISRKFRFYSVLVTSAVSVHLSEAELVPIGGKFTDQWIMPIDPEAVFQRTGYACMNEASFPKNSVNSENTYIYYDFDCDIEPPLADSELNFTLNQERCHWTAFPNISCLDALDKYIGSIKFNALWTRLPWSENVAAKWRYGKQISESADLEGYTPNLINEINLSYRFFENNSCTLVEGSPSYKQKAGCVDKAGWRQLLKFTSTEINVGKTDLVLGDVTDPLYFQYNVFTFDKCHQHYHFNHYGIFYLGATPGRKVGFCLQSTYRYHNNEWTSLNNPFYTCSYQGIAAGWGDDYNQGIDCQWIDVTDIPPGRYVLGSHVNNDNFMCEGEPIQYPNGTKKFVPTSFVNINNETEYREACKYTKNFAKNNIDQTKYTFRGKGSIVVEPCKRKAQITPMKDCDFRLELDNLTCEANKTTSISFKKSSKVDVIVRVCESSVELGHSTFCEYNYALANGLFVGDSSKTFKLTFKCPGARSEAEPGGRYSILVSTLIPGQTIPKVVII